MYPLYWTTSKEGTYQTGGGVSVLHVLIYMLLHFYIPETI